MYKTNTLISIYKMFYIPKHSKHMYVIEPQSSISLTSMNIKELAYKISRKNVLPPLKITITAAGIVSMDTTNCIRNPSTLNLETIWILEYPLVTNNLSTKLFQRFTYLMASLSPWIFEVKESYSSHPNWAWSLVVIKMFVLRLRLNREQRVQ